MRAIGRPVEQIGHCDWREHEIVVVDHAVVVDRGIVRVVALAQVTKDGELADIFFVRDLAVGRESLEHRMQAALDGGGLQRGHQEADRHQRVAPEIGVEPPGSGEEFFAIAEEGERIPRPNVGSRRGGEERRRLERGERRLAGERPDLQPDRAALARADANRRSAAAQLARQHVKRELVAGSSVEAVARPADAAARDDRQCRNLGGRDIARLEVA